MSLNFLSGLLATRQNDFSVFKDVSNSWDSSLIEFDKKMKELAEKKFSSEEQRLKFLNEDIDFHWKALRSQKEGKDAVFLKAIFMPYDVYRFGLICRNENVESRIGYYSLEEIKNIVNKKNNLNFISVFSDKDLEFINGCDDDNSTYREQLFKWRFKFLMAQRFDFINYYLNIEYLIDHYRIEEIRKKISLRVLKMIKNNDPYELELLKFYLPFLLKESYSVVNLHESIFLYFQKRFVLWKLIDPYLI
jgi:hypothetical protein